MSKSKKIKLIITDSLTERRDDAQHTAVTIHNEKGVIAGTAVLVTIDDDINLHKRFTEAIKMIIE